ncbi:SAD/SRA domain-containing protein [Edaphobacter aggregans]|uniref:SAD/SRA domain-containing protein n=1 Tax=Edaphobacter aggregans TaxID=570835 RepID=A0A3R9NX52_9BACT|nr:HNH endonuclease [Edaphobacter aggregans]RSL16716.1 SAD/SRA domain-containing protein [Edaphobacter aggregans]
MAAFIIVYQMQSNEIISYLEMCSREGLSLQRGMNFNATLTHSVVLSSHRPGAPYDDVLEENGTVLIYEGHDEPRTRDIPYPKQIEPLRSKNGKLTQNGFFHEAAQACVRNEKPPVRIRVYEKIKAGIWSYNGLFELLDSWTETSGSRRVYKFKLHSIPDEGFPRPSTQDDLEQRRIIPSHVKLAVWKRDKGACVECGSRTNLHFDHILPYSKGGTSETEANIQLLCMKHNMQKGARLL